MERAFFAGYGFRPAETSLNELIQRYLEQQEPDDGLANKLIILNNFAKWVKKLGLPKERKE